MSLKIIFNKSNKLIKLIIYLKKKFKALIKKIKIKIK